MTTIWRRGCVLPALAVCLLVVAGCGGSDDGGDERARTTLPPPPAQPARPLPDEWYEDADGDLVPTAVERAIGTDPEVDECLQEGDCAGPGPVTALERSNTLLILDSSGSMAGSAGGGTSKLDAAKRALRRYVAGMPDSLALGFMVYGHKGSNKPAGKAESCAGVELLDPIGTAASKRFDRALKRFRAAGYTPLGASLRKARTAFAGRQDAINRIILVSDGIETCGGDPVREARKLKQADIKVTADVVGFDVAKPEEARRLRAIAEASGGTYTDARTTSALDDHFDRLRKRAADLTRQYLCVLNERTQISLCQTRAGTKASLYMNRAAREAFKAGRQAEADEIDRLNQRLEAVERKRDEAFERQSDAAVGRVERELDAANRRVERLDR